MNKLEVEECVRLKEVRRVENVQVAFVVDEFAS